MGEHEDIKISYKFIRNCADKDDAGADLWKTAEETAADTRASEEIRLTLEEAEETVQFFTRT